VGSRSTGLDGRGARGGLDVMQLGLGDGPQVRGARSGSRPGRPRPGGLAGRPAAGAAGGLESGVLGARRDWAGRRRGQAGSPDETAAWSCRRVVVLWSGGGCGAERRSDVGAARSRRRDRGPGPLPDEDTADEGVGLPVVDRRGQRPWALPVLARTARDRDVTVIAYRFAWALEHGAASLLDVPVLGHRCDHRSASGSGRGTCRPPATWRTPASGPAAGTPSAHPYETAAAPAAGSRACATCSASAASELKAAIDAGLILDAAQLALWSDDEPSPTTANGFPDTGGAAASSEAGAA